MDAVKGKMGTCAEGVRDELQLVGAEYLDQPVVVEGHLTTSRGMDDLLDFCREVLKAVGASGEGCGAASTRATRHARDSGISKHKVSACLIVEPAVAS
jgi:hypothetical protein